MEATRKRNARPSTTSMESRPYSERTLQWNTGIELFNGFEEVLIDTALANWEDLIAPIPEADKTVLRFEATLQAMYRKYVGAESCDTQIEYFKTLRKPIKLTPLDHSSRMLTLARYGNKLPGIEPPLTEDQIKKTIFHSFPPKWQQQFVRSGQHLATTLLTDIIEFMSNEKSFADAQDPARTKDKKKAPVATKSLSFKKRKSSNSRNSFTPQKKRNTESRGALSNDDECPIHGGHCWQKCFDNPNGDSYKPRGAGGRRSGTGGRGCGRGGNNVSFAGRGNEEDAETQDEEVNIILKRQILLQILQRQQRIPRGTPPRSITLIRLVKVLNGLGIPKPQKVANQKVNLKCIND
jgi:hypothetical protein